MSLAHRGIRHKGEYWALLALAALSALPMLTAYMAMATRPLLRGLETGRMGAVVVALYLPYVAAARWVLSQPAVYLALSVTTILCALLALRRAPRTRDRMAPPIILLVLVLLFPAAYRYRPALSGAPGYRTIVVTRVGWPDSVTRAARQAAEMRRCEYALLGWSEGALYYSENCDGRVRLWALAPDIKPRPWEVSAVPSEWDHTVISKGVLLSRVRADQVRPVSAEAMARSVMLAGDGLASLDGTWVALIGQRPYGPQDVILLGMERLEARGY